MFFIFKNDLDFLCSSDYYENYIESRIKNYIENNKELKIKFLFFLIHLFILFYIYYRFLTFENLILSKKSQNADIIYSTNKNNIIEIDNKIEQSEYEENVDFSQYSTPIKAIAIYFPNIYSTKFTKKIIEDIKLYGKRNLNIKKYYQENLYLVDYQQNNKDKKNNFDKNSLKSYNFIEYKIITKQINLAKNHGLYGFAFYVYFFSSNIIFDKYLNTFLKFPQIDFKYLFIIKHRDLFHGNENFLIIEKFNKTIPHSFIWKIKKYLIDKRYLNIDSKPIICLDNFEDNSKLISIAKSWRNEAKKIGLKDLFFISSLNKKNFSNISKTNIFSAVYENLPKCLLKTRLLVNFIKNYTFFTGLIYKNIEFKTIDNFTVFRGSTLENEFKIKNHTVFGEYSPESFYIMNKNIINWTLKNLNDSNKFIFINSWNNYYDGNYLEPENKFGFASLNALSKALFNLNFKSQPYNISNLINSVLIAIQAHIFWIDLIDEVIKKTNNIPVKFDLYITTNNLYKKKIIKKHIKSFSKSNYFEIKIVKNKGRDVLPLLVQMGPVINKYKYFCHIHTKKSLQAPRYGLAWRKYLYKNLLGNSEIISRILTDFENNENLGFIFPEAFYEAKEAELKLNRLLINSINYLINKMFKGNIMGQKLDFPAGDMFWAKSKAVYQIFTLNIKKDIFMEGKGPQTLLFAIERIWLYIVKFNGYYYKKNYGYY